MCTNFHLCRSTGPASTVCVCDAPLCFDCQRKLMSCYLCAFCIICKRTPTRSDARRFYCAICDIYCCDECCRRCESDGCRKRVCVRETVVCGVCNDTVCADCLADDVCRRCTEASRRSAELVFEIDPVK